MNIEELAGNKLTADVFLTGMDLIERLAKVITRDCDRPGFPSSWGHEVRCLYGEIEDTWKRKYSDLRKQCETREDATRVIMPDDISRLYKEILANPTVKRAVEEELSNGSYSK
jgi:hypothetical protein